MPATLKHDLNERSLAPYVVAVAIAVAFFAVVETVRPYYFFQDDNRDFYVPLYLHSYRSAADGQLAQYNFFQSLGRPHFSSGQAASLHPVPYLAIYLSEALLGHPFGTADIHLLLYLLLAVTGAVFLARLLGLSSAAAVFASVAWAYTPYNMLITQSWATYATVIGTLPWIVASALLVYRGRRALGGSMFVIAHLLLIYTGSPQPVLYAGFLEAGLIVLIGFIDYANGKLTGEEAKRKAITFTLLVALVAGLSLPLVIPMWTQAQRSAYRTGSLSDRGLRTCSIAPAQLLNGLVFPFRRLYDTGRGEWCETTLPASFVHQGYLVTLLLAAYPWLRRRLPAEQRRVFDASLVIALLLVLAMMGWLTYFIAMIPVANRFRWPFKFFPFANLLLVMVAAAGFDVLLAKLRAGLRRIAGAAVLIAVQAVNVTALDLTFPSQGFFEHLDPVPLQEPLKERFGAGRIVTMGWKESTKGHTVHTAGYNYATVWELHYLGGYDPLMPARNLAFTWRLDYSAILNRAPKKIDFDYLRSWGVRWYVVTRPFLDLYGPELRARGFRQAYSEPHRVVFEDVRAAPLVGSADCRTLSIGRLGDDLTAAVDCTRDSEVQLRFLSNPYFTATVDGSPVEITNHANGQMSVRLGRGTHRLRLAYDDPAIDLGLVLALLSAIAAAACLVSASLRKPSEMRRDPARAR
jgi:hypothetical protein